MIYVFIRVLGRTLRYRVDDRTGIVVSGKIEEPVIWTFWHNQVLLFPYVSRRYFPGNEGAALTSASGDGEIMARTLARFGYDAVRGSSSRRGKEALRKLVRVMRDGRDTAITPDGPRGPLYVLQPGLVKLAQLSGTAIVPVHIRSSHAWRLKSWDRFRIPVPFSRAHCIIYPLQYVPRTSTEEEFEIARRRIEDLLNQEINDDELKERTTGKSKRDATDRRKKDR